MPNELRNELNLYLSAILETLLEADLPVPESTVYSAVPLSKWNLIRKILVDGGLVSIRFNAMELTAAGRKWRKHQPRTIGRMFPDGLPSKRRRIDCPLPMIVPAV